MKSLFRLICSFSLIVIFGLHTNAQTVNNDEVKVTGELQQWHKVTLLVGGPTSSETGTPNPFLDYKLSGVFTQGELSYVVPGYFAADGDAANTGAVSGNVWKVHFTPPTTGIWNYSIRLRSGSNVAIDANTTAGTAVSPLDNTSGTFEIAASDKTGKDLRGKGRLEYVGEHHLRFAGNGEWFLKAGPDSPENFLAYEDFDNTPDAGGRRKSWSPHQRDWSEGDPSWKGGKGTEIIGAINYLASRGLNSFSFLSMNINGDDKNVYPYVNSGNHKQMDCSKLDQWEVVFEHGQKMGMYLHFKTQETENEMLLDNGNTGTERKLYYRELIARYGHHLALNWNLGEENGHYGNTNQSTAQRIAMAKYLKETDPYKNNIVLHTAPGKYNEIYTPLLGNKSELTGLSIQTGWNNVHNITGEWVKKSATAGKKWVCANDEQNGANQGVPEDAAGFSDNIRKETLWGNYMAGGAGVEYYFGYETEGTDLDCEDYRNRELNWRYCGNALLFFNRYVPYWSMKPDDSKTSTGWCLYNEDVSVVYLKSGGNPNVTLGAGTFDVFWYNPKSGGALIAGSTGINGGGSRSIGASPNTSQDWAALIQKTDYVHTCNANCSDDLDVVEVSISPDYILLDKAGDTKQLNADIYPSNAADKTVSWESDDTNVATVDANGLVTAVGDGKAQITVTTTDGSKTASVGVSIGASGGTINYGDNWVVFEAESTISDLGLWVMRTPADAKYRKGTRTDAGGNVIGPINETYIEFTGNTEDGGTPTSPLIYKFTAPKTADYRLTMRILQNLEGAVWDKCNDVYVKLEGNFTPGGTSATMDILKSNTKLYGRGKDNWGSMVQFDVNHAKHAARYNLIEGEEYVLTISGRAQRTCLDYILFYENSLNLKVGEEIDIATQNDEKYRPQIMQCNEIKARDFDKWTGIAGFTDASTDSKAGLDILQIGNRDAWAAAEYTYSGPAMSAYFKVNAMQETDGESTYKLSVNGELLGEGTNNRIHGTTIEDYTIQRHEINMNPFYLQDGDVVRVEFNNATNGLVPEGTLTATSRGRWYSMEICTDNVERVPASGVELLPAMLDLSKNNTYALTANVMPINAYNDNVVWVSDNLAAVTIDADGVVTGVAEGSAKIMVTTVDGGFKDSCEITVVTKAVSSIVVDPKTIEIIEGQTAMISPVFMPSDASNKNVSWTSDSTQYVTVNAAGQVTAMGPGTANVIVSSEDGSFVDTCVVTVPNIKFYNLSPVQDAYTEGGTGFNNADLKAEGTRRIVYLMFDLSDVPETISAAELSLAVGGDAGNGTLKVQLGNNNNWSETNISSANAPSASGTLGSLDGTFAKGNTYTWTLNAALMSGGDKLSLIVTQSGGSDVWFTSKEGNAAKKPVLKLTCPNEPGDAPVEGVEITCLEEDLRIGDVQMMSATVLPSNAKNTNVSWTSSKPDIASIEANGKITALTLGTTTITVTTDEGDFTKTCEVKVVEAPGQSPYGGSAAAIPGIIEIENYDEGGEGVAYHDTDAANTGAMYRTDDVDIEARDGGHNVGWTAAGEWLEYTVNVSAGTYDIEARMATIHDGKTVTVTIGDSDPITIPVPNTGDWATFQTVTVKDAKLKVGENEVMRITFPVDGVNFNWLNFIQTDVDAIADNTLDVGLSVYPNPVYGSDFTIEFSSNNSKVDVNILDLQGRSLYNTLCSDKQLNISKSVFKAKGIYLIQARNTDGVRTQKLMIP